MNIDRVADRELVSMLTNLICLTCPMTKHLGRCCTGLLVPGD
jgi:hypothetical protein